MSVAETPAIEGRPALSDLHVGDPVQIFEGPFAPRSGLLHGLNGKVAHVRMPNMWRRDIVVAVPVAFIANVSAEIGRAHV